MFTATSAEIPAVVKKGEKRYGEGDGTMLLDIFLSV